MKTILLTNHKSPSVYQITIKRLSKVASWISRKIDYIAILARFLLRRRFKTNRPARLDIRARKPWTFARLRLCGWYVLFGISIRCYHIRLIFSKYRRFSTYISAIFILVENTSYPHVDKLDKVWITFCLWKTSYFARLKADEGAKWGGQYSAEWHLC